MDDIVLQPMFESIFLNGLNKDTEVILTLTNALAVNTGAVVAKDLISDDRPNDLKLGSDDKLLVKDPTDFLALYLLERGNL